MKHADLSRRGFLGTLAAAGAGLMSSASSLRPIAAHARTVRQAQGRLTLCVFSKHLQFLDFEQLADVAAEIGFEGIDLTVRPDGHVLPENVAVDLPRAVAAIRANGLQVPTITTAITSVDDPHAREILETAASLEIPGYRMGWIEYDAALGVAGTLDALKPQLADLATLNEQLGLHGDYQNHAGTYVGSAVWDLATLFQDFDPAWIGVQFDIRHATVEGMHTWPLGLDLLSPLVHSLVVKDFRRIETESGADAIEDVPLGKGHVDFPAFWQEIRRLGIRCPISVHFEYPMPGSTTPLSEEALRTETIEVMRRDLAMLRKMLVQAGIG